MHQIVVHPDEESLAASVAARLITAIIDVQAARGSAGIVLTGGGMGSASQAAVAADPAARAVDWGRVDFYWGDERFLPDGHPDRNATQAQQALLDAVRPDPNRVHPMPGSDGRWGGDAAAAAEAYWEHLQAVAGAQQRQTPRFDVLMLGVGPDAHVASLFPGHPGAGARQPGVVPVFGSPKPPPTRLSFTLPLIRSAAEVWLIAAGAEKAAALAQSLAPGTDPRSHPAAGATGRERTLVLIDAAAAAELPAHLLRRS